MEAALKALRNQARIVRASTGVKGEEGIFQPTESRDHKLKRVARAKRFDTRDEAPQGRHAPVGTKAGTPLAAPSMPGIVRPVPLQAPVIALPGPAARMARRGPGALSVPPSGLSVPVAKTATHGPVPLPAPVIAPPVPAAMTGMNGPGAPSAPPSVPPAPAAKGTTPDPVPLQAPVIVLPGLAAMTLLNVRGAPSAPVSAPPAPVAKTGMRDPVPLQAPVIVRPVLGEKRARRGHLVPQVPTLAPPGPSVTIGDARPRRTFSSTDRQAGPRRDGEKDRTVRKPVPRAGKSKPRKS